MSSIIIFLLNENMNKVQSVEQIYFGKLDDYRFRHFVTNSKNSLVETYQKSLSTFINS